jgi:hypothetical protein
VEIAHKYKRLVSPSFLDPTEIIKVVTAADNDDNTVVMSNLATRSHKKPQQQPETLAALARTMYGNPKPQYLNAITIATNLTVADTGAMSIFVVDGVDVENKQVATKPLTVSTWAHQKTTTNAPFITSLKPGHIAYWDQWNYFRNIANYQT